jgi:bacterioferritin-associated ferredoxin
MGVSDRAIREVVEGGACSVAEVTACTGAGSRCGTCRASIAEIVDGKPSVGPASARRLPLARVSTAA